MSRQLKKPWLEAYLEYVADSEAPEDYRLWCGISAIGAALKRKVCVKRGFIDVYPNQYIVLVGPPGVGKGTAMNPAISLVKEANVAHYIEDRATAEAIEETLATGFAATGKVGTFGNVNIMGIEHAATAVAPELSVFLGASDWMLQFMCTLWDKNEFSYATKKSGSTTIKDNCFSLLGACTPDYIRKINKDSMAAVAGGFTSRTVFVYANKKAKTIAWPLPATALVAMKKDLVDDLRTIATLNGEFSWDDDAKDCFIDFYNNTDANIDEFESEVLINFRARMWSHVVKNAMILSVSESDDLVIKLHHISESIRLINKVFASLDVTFRGVGESNLADATDRIMKFIEKKHQCSRSEILRANWKHITDEDLTRVLMSLCVMGFCREKTVGSSLHYEYLPSFATPTTTKPKTMKMGAGIP
jgi:hypothetical protein